MDVLDEEILSGLHTSVMRTYHLWTVIDDCNDLWPEFVFVLKATAWLAAVGL